jgi:uncharacterized protein YjcR
VAKGVPEVPIQRPTLVPRQRHIRLSSVQIDRLVADYLAGNSTITIGRKYGVDPQTVSDHLKRRGVEVRQQSIGVPDSELATVQALRHDGWTLARIGEKYGCSGTAVSNAIKRHTTSVR